MPSRHHQYITKEQFESAPSWLTFGRLGAAVLGCGVPGAYARVWQAGGNVQTLWTGLIAEQRALSNRSRGVDLAHAHALALQRFLDDILHGRVDGHVERARDLYFVDGRQLKAGLRATERCISGKDVEIAPEARAAIDALIRSIGALIEAHESRHGTIALRGSGPVFIDVREDVPYADCGQVRLATDILPRLIEIEVGERAKASVGYMIGKASVLSAPEARDFDRAMQEVLNRLASGRPVTMPQPGTPNDPQPDDQNEAPPLR